LTFHNLGRSLRTCVLVFQRCRKERKVGGRRLTFHKMTRDSTHPPHMQELTKKEGQVRGKKKLGGLTGGIARDHPQKTKST